jgi:uncharacterized membrane protein
MTFLKTLMLLALIVWIGGIIFFAFVLAPTVFAVLPTIQLAGNVVSHSLTILHWIGIISGIIFLICSLLYNQSKYARARPFALIHTFVLLMVILTAISQFGITPRMQALRPQIEAAPAARVEFDRLHAWSTRSEGGVLFLGLAVVILTARRFS